MQTQTEYTKASAFNVKNIFAVVSIFGFMALSLSHSETKAAELCSRVFVADDVAAENLKAGPEFLHKRDSQLHTTAFVGKAATQYKRSTGTNLTKPADKIDQWLNYLNHLSRKADSSPRTQSVLKEALYKQFVIKTEEVPQSYYDLQIRIARDRGHGDIVLTKEQQSQMAETLIVDQKKSLDQWTEYLISKDTGMYPMWLKYWMVSGMTKLSKYDPKTGAFGNRSKETVAPFPELNREALAIVADAVLKKVHKKSLDEIKDPDFLKLLEGMNFGKLYGRILFGLGVGKEGQFKTNEGRWFIYRQGSDHMALVKSLEGRNTGWCTAGEATAKDQLRYGDFHVFYSLDEKGQPTIPRVAVRMESDEIAEVRGVGKDQNLDPQIHQSSVVTTKMQEFGAKAKSFEKKDRDMKYLTEIERKNSLGMQLSKDDLIFLYEIEDPINGFGYRKDPRIDNIKRKRDVKDDLVNVFDHKYTREDISVTREEALSGKAKMHVGELNLDDLASAQGLRLPKTVIGDLNLFSLTSAEGLRLPETVKGNLVLNSLTSAEGLHFPKTVGGFLNLRSLTSMQGLTLPETVGGYLNLNSLRSAEGLKLPETINGDLHLSYITSAKGLKLPRTVNGTLDLGGLTSPDGLKLPEIIKGDLVLNRLTSIVGLHFPRAIDGSLELRGLTSAQGLTLPETIKGTLNLGGLRSAKDLKLPKTINGSLLLDRLTSAEGLKLPKTINGSLHLGGLTTVDGLELPETINGHLILKSLTSVQGLKRPKGIDKYLGPSDWSSQ